MSKNDLYERKKPPVKKESIIYMLVMVNIKLKPRRRSRGKFFLTFLMMCHLGGAEFCLSSRWGCAPAQPVSGRSLSSTNSNDRLCFMFKTKNHVKLSVELYFICQFGGLTPLRAPLWALILKHFKQEVRCSVLQLELFFVQVCKSYFRLRLITGERKSCDHQKRLMRGHQTPEPMSL